MYFLLDNDNDDNVDNNDKVDKDSRIKSLL